MALVDTVVGNLSRWNVSVVKGVEHSLVAAVAVAAVVVVEMDRDVG